MASAMLSATSYGRAKAKTRKRTGAQRGSGKRIKSFARRGILSGLCGVVFAAAFGRILDLTTLGVVDRKSFGVDDRRFTVQADNVPNRNPRFDVFPYRFAGQALADRDLWRSPVVSVTIKRPDFFKAAAQSRLVGGTQVGSPALEPSDAASRHRGLAQQSSGFEQRRDSFVVVALAEHLIGKIVRYCGDRH